MLDDFSSLRLGTVQVGFEIKLKVQLCHVTLHRDRLRQYLQLNLGN